MGVQNENTSDAGFPETVTAGHWGNGQNSGGSGVESDNVRPKQVQNEDHSKDSLGEFSGWGKAYESVRNNTGHQVFFSFLPFFKDKSLRDTPCMTLGTRCKLSIPTQGWGESPLLAKAKSQPFSTLFKATTQSSYSPEI